MPTPAPQLATDLAGPTHVQINGVRPQAPDAKRRLYDLVRIIAVDLESDRSLGFVIGQPLEY